MENRKRILWITNMMPGFVARELGIQGTNKEGWIEGFSEKIRSDNKYKLGIAFPVNDGTNYSCAKNDLDIFSFNENILCPEKYDDKLESQLEKICEEFNPDIVQIFGTEFPHTLAHLKNDRFVNRTIIHIQGIVEECEKIYTEGLPENVINRVTFRDFVKHDSILEQKKKYLLRGKNEHEAFTLARNVCGRTAFDKNHVASINGNCSYYKINETLRAPFYEKRWSDEKCDPHRIFVSQGNYPLKGLHIVLEALAIVKKKYPDVKLYISGDKITSFETIKDKLKLSSYGKYLRTLISENDLWDNVSFTGQISTENMIEQYLSAQVFVMSSFLENSPNSLGEAMLVGMPTIASKVGGAVSMADDNVETLFYEPHDVKKLAEHIEKIFEDFDLRISLGENARKRAQITHNQQDNYKALIDAYESILGNNS